MVTVHEAKELIKNSVKVIGHELVSLNAADGRVLSTDVYSDINIPGFNQSAMDGYAVNSEGPIAEGAQFNLVGEIKAGDHATIELQVGEACRIFTGAMVPEGANSVVIQEVVEASPKVITVLKSVNLNANIREEGEQISTGDTAFQKGTVLNPAGIGFLAMLGVDKVKLIRMPKITVIVTGNELVQPGNSLEKGQIYESNSITIVSALKGFGFTDVNLLFVKDDYESTFKAVKEAIGKSDMVIASGGISVGDYDFVGKAVRENGVNEIFYKVKQKPGKPLFFGAYDTGFVFGLPGNPASALTAVYSYVLPALNQMIGKDFVGLPTVEMALSDSFIKKGDRAQFLKGFYQNDVVELLDGQSSAMMHTYAVANCLVFVDEHQMEIAKGDRVTVHILA